MNPAPTVRGHPDPAFPPGEQSVIGVVGPTASGKSALALELAERFGGEIVSTDSLQVYRFLDIGTAKPGPMERARVPHHLIDLVNPDESFSAGAYVRAAREVLADLGRHGRVPILCGGTGLYFRALVQGLAAIPPVPDHIRKDVQFLAEREGLSACHRELARVDPDSAARLHPHDSQRILRALEVFRGTGRPLSAYQRGAPFGPAPRGLISVGIAWDRAALRERIVQRVRKMLDSGWIDEVRQVLAMGYSPRLKPLQSIGYREIVEHVEGRRAADGLVAAIATRTRQYAKRQMTWFRADPGIWWVAPGQEGDLFRAVERFLEAGAPPAPHIRAGR
jgi:tRNA dimethylallyltransferase